MFKSKETKEDSDLKKTISLKDKIYTFAMNGQTGKFIGNIPVDKKKKKW